MMQSPAWAKLSPKAHEVYPALIAKHDSLTTGNLKPKAIPFGTDDCRKFGIKISRNGLYSVMEEYHEHGFLEYIHAGRGGKRMNAFVLSDKWRLDAHGVSNCSSSGEKKQDAHAVSNSDAHAVSNRPSSVGSFSEKEDVMETSDLRERENHAGVVARVKDFMARTKNAADPHVVAEAAVDAIGETPMCVGQLEEAVKKVGADQGREILKCILANPDLESDQNPHGRVNLYAEVARLVA